MQGLTPLQSKILEGFFARIEGFVLSGGAALVGSYLHHRTTLDLDLFTTSTSARVAAPHRTDAGIIVDTPQDILASKLCALLSRGEIRDLIDVEFLERSGIRIEQVLETAMKKDASLTPGQLAWVLSEITISDDAPIPGGQSPQQLRDWLSDLIDRLTALAFPS